MTAPTVDTPLTAEAIEHNARNLARYHSGEAEYFRAENLASRARLHDGAAETITSLLAALLAARRENDALENMLGNMAAWMREPMTLKDAQDARHLLTVFIVERKKAVARAALAATPEEK